MVAINPLAREVTFKVVFYGPGLGGKTTSLQVVHDKARPEQRGKLVSLATPIDRTLYFDYLPYRLAPVRGMGVRLQLFTVPGQVHYNATRKLVLAGADGVVFVADSQALRSDANLESFENLRENLGEQRRELDSLPLVFQYNKRDLPDVLSFDKLERLLNPQGAPAVETVAVRGEGIFETLDIITQKVLEAFEHRPSRPHSPPPLPLSSSGGGLAEALRAVGSEVAAAAESQAAREAAAREALSAEGEAARDGGAKGGGPAPAREGGGGARAAEGGGGAGASEIEAMRAPAKAESGMRPGPDLELEGDDILSMDPAKAAELLLGGPLPAELSPPSDPLCEIEIAPASLAEQAPAPEGEGEPAVTVAPSGGSSVVPEARGPSAAPDSRGPSAVPDPRGSSAAPDSGEMTTLAPASFSFAELWPRRERDAVLAAEGAMAAGDYRRAVELLDVLASKATLAAVSLVGATDAGAAATTFVPLLLGVSGPRYAAFLALVRYARAGGAPEPKQALAAYSLVVDLMLAKEHLSSTVGSAKPGNKG